MHRTATTAGLFFLYLWFLGSGSIWVAVASFLPGGLPRQIAVATFGILFAGAFLWLLVFRLKRLFAGYGSGAKEIAFAALNVSLLVFAFASIFRMLGIVDTTVSDNPISHDLWSSIYFSIVTFTTLGYGDFQPQGIGRLIAAVESLTGYLVLGIFASTAAELLKSQGKQLGEQKASGQNDSPNKRHSEQRSSD